MSLLEAFLYYEGILMIFVCSSIAFIVVLNIILSAIVEKVNWGREKLSKVKWIKALKDLTSTLLLGGFIGACLGAVAKFAIKLPGGINTGILIGAFISVSISTYFISQRWNRCYEDAHEYEGHYEDSSDYIGGSYTMCKWCFSTKLVSNL